MINNDSLNKADTLKKMKGRYRFIVHCYLIKQFFKSKCSSLCNQYDSFLNREGKLVGLADIEIKKYISLKIVL